MNEVRVNINEAKARLSKYARLVKEGQTIILCDRNRPFAEIRPLRGRSPARRPFGLAGGLLSLPEDFNDPDPEIEALFAETSSWRGTFDPGGGLSSGTVADAAS